MPITDPRPERAHQSCDAARAAARADAGHVLTLHGITEAQPGERWQALFEAVWPAYRAWYLSDGESARPDLATGRRMLEKHLPELVPTWHRLVELTAGDELAARMLTLWDPPQFLPGCSQAVLNATEPALVRNYDYSPALFEQVVYSSAFTGSRVLGTADCLWGLLDGMNDAGLAVSLAFGGRPGSAPGFAAPLVLRYLLEVATCTEHAQQLLHDLPIAMAYNLTIVDRAGVTATAFVAPGRQPEFTDAPVATNHRGTTPEYPEHARRFRSVERQDILLGYVHRGISAPDLGERFLQPPLHSTDYAHGFGTLYTAVYEPAAATVEYRWPGERWRRTFSSPSGTKTVVLRSPEMSAPHPDRPNAAPPAHGGVEPAADLAVGPAADLAVGPAVGPAADLAVGPAVDLAVDLGDASIAELAALVRRAVQELARRPDSAVFAELLLLQEVLGSALGDSARTLAEHGSWARVADVAGTTRQAAWHRWRA